jgi:hypothetical protein
MHLVSYPLEAMEPGVGLRGDTEAEIRAGNGNGSVMPSSSSGASANDARLGALSPVSASVSASASTATGTRTGAATSALTSPSLSSSSSTSNTSNTSIPTKTRGINSRAQQQSRQGVSSNSYQLVAQVSHVGRLGGGHYTAQTRVSLERNFTFIQISEK